MTPERIAELRELHGRFVKMKDAASGDRLSTEQWDALEAMRRLLCIALLQNADALLAECERPWTAELPKESGWYWERFGNGPPTIRYIDESLSVWEVGESYSITVKSYRNSEWSGPLSPPQQAGAQT